MFHGGLLLLQSPPSKCLWGHNHLAWSGGGCGWTMCQTAGLEERFLLDFRGCWGTLSAPPPGSRNASLHGPQVPEVGGLDFLGTFAPLLGESPSRTPCPQGPRGHVPCPSPTFPLCCCCAGGEVPGLLLSPPPRVLLSSVCLWASPLGGVVGCLLRPLAAPGNAAEECATGLPNKSGCRTWFSVALSEKWQGVE